MQFTSVRASIRRLTNSPEARSVGFSLVFSPIALILMNSSMADVQARTASGLPLASVEGMIGMVLATLLIALVATNSDRSSTALVTATVVSIPIGLTQYYGLFHLPGVFSLLSTEEDMAAAVHWNLHPLAVTFILAGASIAVWHTHRTHGTSGFDTWDEHSPYHERHQRVRVATSIAAIPLGIATVVLLTIAAPADTILYASEGLSGLSQNHGYLHWDGIIVAVLFGLLAVLSRWSLFASQFVAWILLAFPSFLVIPMWITLSGTVITPGPVGGSPIGIVLPVLASLSMLLGASTSGVIWARRTLRLAEEDSQLCEH